MNQCCLVAPTVDLLAFMLHRSADHIYASMHGTALMLPWVYYMLLVSADCMIAACYSTEASAPLVLYSYLTICILMHA